MLKFKIDVGDALTRAGFTTYKAKSTKGLSQDTLKRIKNEDIQALSFKALDAICKILDMQPGQLLEYEPTDEEEPQKAAGKTTV